ncbi:hypothetical protein PanWU01x14_208230, partial [Parasponia andersonii]
MGRNTLENVALAQIPVIFVARRVIMLRTATVNRIKLTCQPRLSRKDLKFTISKSNLKDPRLVKDILETLPEITAQVYIFTRENAEVGTSNVVI